MSGEGESPKSGPGPRRFSLTLQGEGEGEAGTTLSCRHTTASTEPTHISTTHANNNNNIVLDPDISIEDVTIPWDHYQEGGHSVKLCSFATRSYFWRRVQWALQFTLFACLPAAIIAFTFSEQLEVPSMLLPFCVVTTQAFVGDAFSNFIDVCKGFLLILVVLTSVHAANVAAHWAAWGAVYFVVVLLTAFFTVGGVTKNALLLWTVGMVVHFTEENQGAEYGALLVRDCLIGCGFGVLSVVFPAPRSNYLLAKEELGQAFIALEHMLVGLSDALDAPGGVRASKMILLRFKRDKLKDHLASAGQALQGSWYEPFVGSQSSKLEARLGLLSSILVPLEALLETVEEFNENQNWVDYKTRRHYEIRATHHLNIDTGSTSVQVDDGSLDDPTSPDEDNNNNNNNTNNPLGGDFGPSEDIDGGVIRTFEKHFGNGFVKLSSAMSDKLRTLWRAAFSKEEDGFTDLLSESKKLEKYLDSVNEKFLVGLNQAIFKILDNKKEAVENTCNFNASASPSAVFGSNNGKGDSEKTFDKFLSSAAPLGGGPKSDAGASASAAFIPPAFEEHYSDPRNRFPRVKLGYFLFNMTVIAKSLMNFKEPAPWTCSDRLKCCLYSPVKVLKDALALVKGVGAKKDDAVEKAIDSVKMAVAMTSTVAVLLLLDSPEKVFSGPAVIAFVSGADAGQTMRGSAEQLFGTVLGSVAGFVLASISEEPVAMVGWVCLVALISGFMRGSKTYGWVAFYIQFAAFGSIRPNLDAGVALTQIQQNVGAILWYFILIFFVWPHMPSERLQRELRRGFISMKASLTLIRLRILDEIKKDLKEEEEEREADTQTSAAKGTAAEEGAIIQAEPVEDGDNDSKNEEEEPAKRNSHQDHSSGHVQCGDKACPDAQRARLIRLAADLPSHIGEQRKALVGADIEPALSGREFPTHHMHHLIHCQELMFAVVSALNYSHIALEKGRTTAKRNRVLNGVTPILLRVIVEGVQLLDRMIATTRGNLSPRDSLLFKSCLAIDRLLVRLNEVEVTATNELVQDLRDKGVLYEGDFYVPPAVLTTIQCISSLAAALKKCQRGLLVAQTYLEWQTE